MAELTVMLGADHRGADVARHLHNFLSGNGYPTECVGPSDDLPCDYPDLAWSVAKAVADGRVQRGILVCGTGIGMSIAANKVPGVLAALVHDEIGADISRRHNNANVLCLAADLLGARIIERIVETWLTTEFEGGRHARRNDKIARIESGLEPTRDGAAVQPTEPQSFG